MTIQVTEEQLDDAVQSEKPREGKLHSIVK